MSKSESSGSKVARTASKVLRDPGASATAKRLAGSALSQTHTTKVSSAATARTAAKTLNDGRAGSATKRLAGSVLTQRPAKRK